MSLAQKAAEDIKNFANRMRPIMDAADALEKIGSIEQLESEARSKLQEMQGVFEKSDEKLKKKTAELDAVKQRLGELKEQADSVVSRAHDKAAVIVASAESKAADILRIAQEGKQKVTVLFQRQEAEHKERAVEISKEINEKQLRLSEINQELEAARSKITAFMKA